MSYALYGATARQAAEANGVDPDVFERQITQESNWNPEAGSPAGASGIAQIVPRWHPGVDVWDPVASLWYAAGLMRSHLDRYGGDYCLALAAYNAGPGAVEQYGGVPPFEETQRYVRNIVGDQCWVVPSTGTVIQPQPQPQPSDPVTQPVTQPEQPGEISLITYGIVGIAGLAAVMLLISSFGGDTRQAPFPMAQMSRRSSW